MDCRTKDGANALELYVVFIQVCASSGMEALARQFGKERQDKPLVAPSTAAIELLCLKKKALVNPTQFLSRSAAMPPQIFFQSPMVTRLAKKAEEK